MVRNGASALRFFLFAVCLSPGISFSEDQEISEEQKVLIAEMMKDPYFITLSRIGLTREQAPKFKELINGYGLKRQKAILSEMRKNSPNIDKRIAKRMKREAKRFTEDIQALLSVEQLARFQPFRIELEKRLAGTEEPDEDVVRFDQGDQEFR